MISNESAGPGDDGYSTGYRWQSGERKMVEATRQRRGSPTSTQKKNRDSGLGMASGDRALNDQKPRLHVEPLEHEYARHRISLIAYSCACIYRAMLERAGGHPMPSPPTEKQSRLHQKDGALLEALTSVKVAQEHQRLIASELGADDEALLRLLLTGNVTIADAAMALGSSSDRKRKELGLRFRRACEDLARVYESKRAESLSSRWRDTPLQRYGG
jgi:hypothetical protein